MCICCSPLVDRCSLISLFAARCSLCALLAVRCSLFVARCSLLAACCSLFFIMAFSYTLNNFRSICVYFWCLGRPGGSPGTPREYPRTPWAPPGCLGGVPGPPGSDFGSPRAAPSSV